MNHFAEICRKSNKQPEQKKTVNVLDEEIQQKFSKLGTIITTKRTKRI